MVESVTIASEDASPTLEAEAAAQDAAAAAAAKVETPLNGETPTPERPAWLPEKFKTAEDMAKAYGELEKGQGTPKPAETPTEEAAAADEAVQAAGLDMDALSAEYADKGELSTESLAKLAASGITSDMVNSYIAGQEAQTQAVRTSLLEPVGGEEAYGEMTAWATENLDDAAIDAFNSALDSGDMGVIKMAVENLNTKYRGAVGNEPARQLNGKQGDGSLSRYESTADLMKDMGSPEYAKNEAFRAKVQAKLGRSNIM